MRLGIVFLYASFYVLSKCNRKIKRYINLKVHLFHICSGQWARPITLHKYSPPTELDLRGTTIKALCASTAKLLLGLYFGVRRGHVEAKFRDFPEIVRWRPITFRNVLGYP